MEISGALSEVFAALDERNNVDEQRTIDYIEFLVKNGVKALFVGGIAAETLSFSDEERERWLKAVKSAAGNVPIIFQLKPSNMGELKRQVDLAEENDVAVVSLSQPYPIPLSSNELVDYFNKACKLTSLPIMVYNEPTVGKPMDLQTLNSIVKNNENVKFYKDSTHNMIDLHGLIMQNPSINVLAGSDGLIFDIMNAGGKGVVSLVVNPFPELINAEVKALQDGEIEKALELQNKILKVRSILKEGGLTAGYRYAMELRGINVGKAPFPYSNINEEAKSKIKQNLKELNLL
ncbi:MAG: dihydrodipicolinate synthase family protein [Candidatus Parvarchaeota archaeon]|nr:dihydrodipicolinate synthase family protein [Candidatus Parvarchaeum tengchongense]MCW1299299.1 dihydrodipicolinate synthase family protein [Candidatus Parvarchaeum tengchongense]MCW1311834.1 dihydrodipicolinate synthase family protein [Candidatus Parvarchaeum tengchongense]